MKPCQPWFAVHWKQTCGARTDQRLRRITGPTWKVPQPTSVTIFRMTCITYFNDYIFDLMDRKVLVWSYNGPSLCVLLSMKKVVLSVWWQFWQHTFNDDCDKQLNTFKDSLWSLDRLIDCSTTVLARDQLSNVFLYVGYQQMSLIVTAQLLAGGGLVQTFI